MAIQHSAQVDDSQITATIKRFLRQTATFFLSEGSSSDDFNFEKSVHPHFSRVHSCLFLPRRKHDNATHYSQTEMLYSHQSGSVELFYKRAPGAEFQLVHPRDERYLRTRHVGIYSLGLWLTSNNDLRPNLLLTHIYYDSALISLCANEFLRPIEDQNRLRFEIASTRSGFTNLSCYSA